MSNVKPSFAHEGEMKGEDINACSIKYSHETFVNERERERKGERNISPAPLNHWP